MPSRLAWETGQAMADSLLERYLADTGACPDSVDLSVWGTASMRTSGDDVAEVLALLGVRPVWDEASRWPPPSSRYRSTNSAARGST